jgi:hypothetical protein
MGHQVNSQIYSLISSHCRTSIHVRTITPTENTISRTKIQIQLPVSSLQTMSFHKTKSMPASKRTVKRARWGASIPGTLRPLPIIKGKKLVTSYNRKVGAQPTHPGHISFENSILSGRAKVAIDRGRKAREVVFKDRGA